MVANFISVLLKKQSTKYTNVQSVNHYIPFIWNWKEVGEEMETRIPSKVRGMYNSV